MNQPTNPPTQDAGYWLATYPDYDQRLAAMAAYIQACNHPANSATSPLTALTLAPITAT